MTPRHAAVAASAALSLAASILPARGDVIFDDLPSGPGGYNNGATAGGGFTTGDGYRIHNTFTDFGGGFSGWSGFAISEVNNPTTAGFGNQYAVAAPGTGQGGVGRYAIGFDFGDDDRITFPVAAQPLGAYVNNTAYTALSMRDGDAFAKKFGGAGGTDPDFFLLIVEGRDAGGGSSGTASIYLADFRSSDPAQDFIRQEWTWLDLTALSPATASLHFTLSSSDNGTFGMNTPAYFALDTLRVVPEPGSAALLVLGGILVRRLRAGVVS